MSKWVACALSKSIDVFANKLVGCILRIVLIPCRHRAKFRVPWIYLNLESLKRKNPIHPVLSCVYKWTTERSTILWCLRIWDKCKFHTKIGIFGDETQFNMNFHILHIFPSLMHSRHLSSRRRPIKQQLKKERMNAKSNPLSFNDTDFSCLDNL